MKTSRFTDSQIITTVTEIFWKHGMGSASFYKWRAKYGGMDTVLATRMKELEAESARLK